MSISSDLSALGLRASPFTREIDAADLRLPGSMAALAAELSLMSFIEADVPIELLLGEHPRVPDEEEDADGDPS